MTTITRHAQNRIENRLAGICTVADVEKAIANRNFQPGGQTYVTVRRLPRVVHIHDGDKVLVGDTVYAVIDRVSQADDGHVVTVLVRNSTQPTREFRPAESISQHTKNRRI